MKRINPGYYEGEGVWIERTDKGWRTGMLMRQIGQTRFYEFSLRSNLTMEIGIYPTLKRAIGKVQLLADGAHVVGVVESGNSIHGKKYVFAWTDVQDEIAAHPSVTGADRG